VSARSTRGSTTFLRISTGAALGFVNVAVGCGTESCDSAGAAANRGATATGVTGTTSAGWGAWFERWWASGAADGGRHFDDRRDERRG
jgi:hypothetical protein